MDWKAFFRHAAPTYDDEPFTKNTAAEVDFLVRHVLPDPGMRVLDVGCGTGRHALALAERGYQVVGVDLSEEMIAVGKSHPRGAAVRWIVADATEYVHPEPLDAAICLCEGAFGLLGETDDPNQRDLAILRNVRNSLRPGAPFALTALNAWNMARNQATFDSMAQTVRESIEATPGVHIETIERGFTPSELRLLLRAAGFEVDHVGGGTAGAWGLRPVEIDEMELMAIARAV